MDLNPPVRLDAWAITLAAGIVVGTVVPVLAPSLVVASAIVSAGALLWRELVPAEWGLMAILAPLFAAGGVGISLLHAATPDPLAELAALEPGEVVIVGRVASPPVPGGWGYRADLQVEHLWYEGREVLRGGGVEVFAGDLGGVGVGDLVRVDGEISLPELGEGDFDYARYLSTKRISAVVEATGVWPVDEDRGWIGRLHRRTDVALGYGLRPQEAAVVRGMVLGDRSLIPEDLEEAFQKSGITQEMPLLKTDTFLFSMHWLAVPRLREHRRLTTSPAPDRPPAPDPPWRRSGPLRRRKIDYHTGEVRDTYGLDFQELSFEVPR